MHSHPRKILRVVFIENGAGFGGAIVALKTLLSNFPSEAIDAHVITNLAVGGFIATRNVSSHRVVKDRVFNLKRLATKINIISCGKLAGVLLFFLGRLDDFINRLPYFFKLSLNVFLIKPDIIHGNNDPISNREAMLVAKIFGLPYVQHLRGPCGKSHHTAWLLALPDIFVPVSRWLADELLIAGVSRSRIRQVYDGLDISSLEHNDRMQKLRSEFMISKSSIVVAMVGMMVSWKGQDLFIDAAESLLQNSKIPFVFLIIGGTPEHGDVKYKEHLYEKVRSIDRGSEIIFTGHRSDLPSILAEINIVVSASIQPEPLGLVMLEAMANGCVFVAPAHGAAVEVIKDGVNGFIFTPGCAKSLAMKIEAAAASLDGKSIEIDSIKNCIINKFDASKCAMSTYNIYKELI